MSAQPTRTRPSRVRGMRLDPPLLPGAASPSPWLALAIFLLSFLAALELVTVTGAVRAAVAWSPRFAGSITVAVSGAGLESAEAAAARASEIVARSPGVTRIVVLEPDPNDALVGLLEGLSGNSEEADPVRQLEATLGAGVNVKGAAAAISRDLRRENVSASIDDHGVWSGSIGRTALAAAVGAAGLLLVLVVLIWAVAAASAGAAARRRAGRTTLLLHLGATDDMILGPSRTGAVAATALGAVTGAAAAAIVAAAAIWSPEAANWLTSRTGAPIGAASGLDAWNLAAAAIWPGVAVLVALWGAGGAARARLRALL